MKPSLAQPALQEALRIHSDAGADEFFCKLKEPIAETQLYPLRFDPICQHRIWGGQRLAHWLGAPLPNAGKFGEAWLLSDRDDMQSLVAEGPLKGITLAQLMASAPTAMMGALATKFQRFPLLLKFLDVKTMLSVQVHPPDRCTDLIPAGNTGKTEAWVVLEAAPESKVYAGLQPGTSPKDLAALSQENCNTHLASFSPHVGDGVFIEAGTVHSVGDGAVIFEVQENSDVTFRLYDWDHIDAATGKPRDLQIFEALQCIDFNQGVIYPVTPVHEPALPIDREKLFDCSHFRLSRLKAKLPFTVGAKAEPRVVVCIAGNGTLEYQLQEFALALGNVMLLPAAIGACLFRPQGEVTLLEISVPISL